MTTPVLYNLARCFTTTVGTGTLTVSAALPGYLTFDSAGALNGDVIAYAIQDGSNGEQGTGTYNSTSKTLTRTVISSTNSNAAINLSGSAQVFISPNSSMLVPGGSVFGTAAAQNVGTFAQVANNLSDLASAATARTNLGLGSAAVLAASAFLAVANNLSDVASAATARTNLGLGSIATQSAGAVAITGGTITGLAAPSNASDAATKSYVDATISGLSMRDSCQWATAAALPANTYSNGTGGVGATLTGNSNGALTIDGNTPNVGDRVLVQDEAAASYNGIYTVTQVGSGAAPYVLTRATDANSSSNLFSGIFVFVEGGAVNAGAGFTLTTTGSITVGTTALAFTQFSGAGEITAGAGLAKSGNTLSVMTGGISNAMLANSAITLGSTAMSLGSTYGTVAGAITWSGTQTFTNASAIAAGTGAISGGAFNSTGASAGYSAYDQSTSGTAVFYRTGGINRFWDSTAGDVITYGSTGNVTVAGSLLTQLSAGATRVGGFNQIAGTITADVVTIGGHAGSGYKLLNVEDSNGGTLGSGTSRFVVLAGGNVGVGTTAPSAKLNVVGSAGVTGLFVNGVAGNLYIDYTGNGSNYLDGTNNYFRTHGSVTYAILNNTGFYLGNGSSVTNRLDVSGAAAIGSYAGTAAPSNGLIISGNVGIGTTSPSYLLDVNGTARIVSQLGIGTVPNSIFSLTASGIIYSQAGFASNLTNVAGTSWSSLNAAYLLGGNSVGAMAFAWNYSGYGEVNLFVNSGPGSNGGFSICQFPNTSGTPTELFYVNGSGTVVLPAYTQPGTLGVGDTVVISGGYVTPQMYGAAGDGTTDDTTALSNCLNSGKPVLLVGKFKITSAITVTLNDSTGPYGINIVGSGQMLSQIILTTTACNLTINVSYSGNNAGANTQVVLRDFTIVVGVANQGSSTVGALNVIGSAQVGSNQPNYIIDNVNVLPTTAGTHYPNVGIFLKDVRNGTVSRCHVYGLNGATGSGFCLTSSDNGASGNAPVNFCFDTCYATSFNYGIELRPSGDTNHTYENDWQGCYIRNCTLLVNSISIYADSTDGNANALTITGCITYHTVNGVYAVNVQGVTVSGCYFQAGASATVNVSIVNNVNTMYCLGSVTNNIFYAAGFSGMYAVSYSVSGGGTVKLTSGLNRSIQSGGGAMTYNVTASYGDN